MFKKIKKIMLLGLFALLPLNIHALEFKDENVTYNMYERDLSCAENLWIAFFGSHGDLIYTDHNTGDVYRISEDDTCEKLTLDRQLEITKKYMYEGWLIIGDTVGDNKIYSFYESNPFYIKSDDIDFIDGKTYYKMENEEIKEVKTDDRNLTDLQNKLYYEKVYMTLPEKAEIDEDNTTYYECNMDICEAVTTPDLNNILNYYVIGNYVYKREVVATIDSNLHNKIINLDKNKEHAVVGKLADDKYYINIFDINSNLSDVYELNGNLLFQDVEGFDALSVGLYAVTTGDSVKLYNTSKKLLYTIPSVHFLHQYNNDKEIAMVTLDTIEGIQEFYNIKKTVNEPNPATSDNIIINIIIASTTLLVLCLLMFYFIKQNKNAKRI